MKTSALATLAAVALSTPAVAFDYDPDNSGFRALDREITQIENAERLATKKRIETKRQRDQILQDCIHAQLSAIYSADGVDRTDGVNHAIKAVNECGISDKDADFLGLVAEAANRPIPHEPQLATENARAAWEKANAPKKTVQSAKIDGSGTAALSDRATLIYAGLFWLCVIVASWSRREKPPAPKLEFIDLDRGEWMRARVEPVFDIAQDATWSNDYDRR